MMDKNNEFMLTYGDEVIIVGDKEKVEKLYKTYLQDYKERPLQTPCVWQRVKSPR